MDEIIQDDQLTKWFSTYGLITAERILEKYHIVLPQTELIQAIKSPFSFYHLILKIPLKNVLNGIVLQQAGDYHIYAQKLFIDYLLSGESGKDENSPGARIREDLEIERQKLVTLGEFFHELQLKQNELIALSQSALIKIAKDWQQHFESALTQINATLKKAGFSEKMSLIRSALNTAFIHCDCVRAVSSGNQHLIVDEFNQVMKLKLTEEMKAHIVKHMTGVLDILLHFNEQLGSYVDINSEIGEQARTYRTQFYDTIIRVMGLITLLPEYKMDEEQDKVNRESLYFDKTIGDLR